MDGTFLKPNGRKFTARLALGLTAALALAGAMGAGHAEPAADLPLRMVAPPETASLARFQPSAEAVFAERFEPFAGEQPQFALPEHAVDITTIEPAAPEAEDLGSGIASYYGKRFAGRPTASGERFDPQALTAAHRTLPFGSKVRVTNPHNGKAVVVRINDRGPFTRGRHIDLSRRAAEQIGLVNAGHGKVELELLLS